MTTHKTLLSTGVPGLDTLLGGGIPKRQSLLITGQPGSGKTVLASQIAFHVAKQGQRTVLATTVSEAQSKLLDDLSGFEFFSRDHLGEELYFLSVYPWLKKGAKEARDVLIAAAKERKASLMVIDGMRSIRDLWQDEAKLREFFYDLVVGLAACECTAIFITEYPLAKLIEHAESTTVDGILSLSYESRGGTRVRRAEVVKLRGMNHLPGHHVMRMGDNGVTVVPRLETQTKPDAEFKPTLKRASFDLPELDGLLRGGIPEQSSALVAGSAGVGKTLLGLHFAAAGARKGEVSLVHSLTEPRGSLVARAARVSLPLEELLAKKLLHVEYEPAFEMEADEVVDRMLKKIEALKVRRLVFEEVDTFELMLGDRDRARTFLAALIVKLREAGVTTLFTRKTTKVVGPELDFSDTALSGLAENLLFLRHIERDGRLHRVLSILNLRDSEFDKRIKEFEIRDDGVRVLTATGEHA